MAEKRNIFNTDFDIRKEFDIENLFIGELLATNDSISLNFSNTVTFMDGRKKENRVANPKLTELWAGQ